MEMEKYHHAIKCIFTTPDNENKLKFIPMLIDIISQQIEGSQKVILDESVNYVKDHFLELYTKGTKLNDNENIAILIRNTTHYIIESIKHEINGVLPMFEKLMKVDIPVFHSYQNNILKNLESNIVSFLNPKYKTLAPDILLFIVFANLGGFYEIYKIINNSNDEKLIDEVCTFLEHMIVQYGSNELKVQVNEQVLLYAPPTIRVKRLAMFVYSGLGNSEAITEYLEALSATTEETQQKELVNILEERNNLEGSVVIILSFLPQLFRGVDHKNANLIADMAKYLVENQCMDMDLFLAEFKDQWKAFREIIDQFNEVDDSTLSQILLETKWEPEKVLFMADVLKDRPHVDGIEKAFYDVTSVSMVTGIKKLIELAKTHKYDSEFKSMIECKMKEKPSYNEIKLILSILNVIGHESFILDSFVDYILYNVESMRLLDLLSSFSFIPIKYPAEVIFLCPHTQLFYQYVSTHLVKLIDDFENDVLEMKERDDNYVNFLVDLYDNSNKECDGDPKHRVLLWRAFFLSNQLKETSQTKKRVLKTVSELAKNYPHLAFTDTMSLSPEERDYVVKQGDLTKLLEQKIENPLQRIQSIAKAPSKDSINQIMSLIEQIPKTKDSIKELFTIYTSQQFPPSLRTKELSKKIIQCLEPFPDILAEYVKGLKQIPSIKRTVIKPIDKHPLASFIIQAFATIPCFVMELISSNDDLGLKLANLFMYVLFESDAVIDPSTAFPENFWNGFDPIDAFTRMLPPNVLDLITFRRNQIRLNDFSNIPQSALTKVSMSTYHCSRIEEITDYCLSLFNTVMVKAPEIIIMVNDKGLDAEYLEEIDLSNYIDKRPIFKIHAIIDNRGVYIKHHNKLISSAGQKLKSLPKNIHPIAYIYVREDGITAEETWSIVPEAHRTQLVTNEMIAARLFSCAYDYSHFEKNKEFYEFALSLLEKGGFSDGIIVLKDSKEFANYIFDGPIFSNPSFFKVLPNVVLELAKKFDNPEALVEELKNHLNKYPDMCLSIISELMTDPNERIAFIVEAAEEPSIVNNQIFVSLIKNSIGIECDLYSLLFDCQSIRKIVLPSAPEYAADTYIDNWDDGLFDDVLRYATPEFVDSFIALVTDQSKLLKIAIKLSETNNQKLRTVIERLNGSTEWWLQNSKQLLVTKDMESIGRIIDLSIAKTTDTQKKLYFADVLKYTLGRNKPYAALFICEHYLALLPNESSIQIMKYCFSNFVHLVECGIELFEYLLEMDIPTDAIKAISPSILYLIQGNPNELSRCNETIYRFVLLWMTSKTMAQWGAETESILHMVKVSNQNPAPAEVSNYFVENALQRITEENRGYVTLLVYIFTSTAPTSIVYLPFFFDTENLSVFYENQIFVPIIATALSSIVINDMDPEAEEIVYSVFIQMFTPIINGSVMLQSARIEFYNYPNITITVSWLLEIIKTKLRSPSIFSPLFFDLLSCALGVSTQVVEMIISNISEIVNFEIDETNASSYLNTIETILRTGFGDSLIVTGPTSPILKKLVEEYSRAVLKASRLLTEEAAGRAVITLLALFSSDVTHSILEPIVKVDNHQFFNLLCIIPQTERSAQNLKRFVMALLRTNDWVDAKSILGFLENLNPDAHNIEFLLTVAYIAIKKGRNECLDPYLAQIINRTKEILQNTSNDAVRQSSIFKSL